MLELDQCQVHISGHGHMDLSFIVIPIKRQPNVFFPFPILTYFIVLFQYYHEVVGMVLTNILHSEVINHQCEADGTP